MDAALMELGKRAVACEGWRLMPGMLSHEDPQGRVWRVVRPLIPQQAVVIHQERGRRLRQRPPPQSEFVPDLSDSATLGCLLVLVRIAWEDAGVSTGFYSRDMGQWSVYDHNGDHLMQPLEGDAPLFSSEVEALVVALEGAR